MRAISPYGNYSIQLVESVPKKGFDQRGNVVEFSDSKPVIAQFERSGLMKWEEEVALESFNFSGLAEGVHPLTTVSVYDTELAVQRIADPAEREAMQTLIDQRLEFFAEQYPSHFRIVKQPAAPKPWPLYDDADSLADIITVMQATGVSPTTIRLYEVENENRRDIVLAMEELEAELLSEDIEVTV